MPVVRGIGQQMHQLFYNLINNALKFSRPGVAPHIRVACRKLEGSEVASHTELEEGRPYFEISVKDNGIGFEQNNSSKIFNMFQRLHSRDAYAGTGIGLALARKVALNHGGKIWAQSTPGKGATFTVVLPAGNNR